MRSVALRSVLLFPLLLVGAAKAQDVLRIAAIVNDEVISLQDLGERLSLALASAGLNDRPEIRRRFAPQVLRGLIDEKLKSQEAKRLDVRVASGDMERALRRIEKQNKVPKGRLKDFLARKGIKLSVLAGRIEKDLAWSRVVDRAIRPRIRIGQEEINDVLAQIKAGKGKPAKARPAKASSAGARARRFQVRPDLQGCRDRPRSPLIRAADRTGSKPSARC